MFKMNRKGEAKTYLRLLSVRRCCPIATIVELVTEIIEPVIQAPFELVDVEYGKIGGDYVLSIFVDKPGGITLNDTADLTEVISPLLDQIQPVFPRRDESWFGASFKNQRCCGKSSGSIYPCQLVQGS